MEDGGGGPPRVQTHQFSELRPAMATRMVSKGQKASILDPRGSRFEPQREPSEDERGEGQRARAVVIPLFQWLPMPVI